MTDSSDETMKGASRSGSPRSFPGTGVLLVVALTLLLVACPPAMSQNDSDIVGKTVAVTHWQPFGDVAEGQGWLKNSLRTLTTRDLSRIGEISIVADSSYRRRTADAELTDANPNDSENARRIAEATGADVLLVGTYQIEGDRIQLSAVFYDVARRETLSAHSELGGLDQIKTLETRLIKELLRKSGVTLGASEQDWIDREKRLASEGMTFESPRARPEVLRRGDRTESVYQVVGETVPGEVERNNLVVGLHWPGVSVGYQPTPDVTLEFRAEANSDITILGGRYNHHFYRFGKSNLYWGTQLSHVDFVGEVSEGTGFVGGGFLGFEQYVAENLSVKADVGTYFTSLEDDPTGVSVSGIGFALVTGAALHFW